MMCFFQNYIRYNTEKYVKGKVSTSWMWCSIVHGITSQMTLTSSWHNHISNFIVTLYLLRSLWKAHWTKKLMDDIKDCHVWNESLMKYTSSSAKPNTRDFIRDFDIKIVHGSRRRGFCVVMSCNLHCQDSIASLSFCIRTVSLYPAWDLYQKKREYTASTLSIHN